LPWKSRLVYAQASGQYELKVEGRDILCDALNLGIAEFCSQNANY